MQARQPLQRLVEQVTGFRIVGDEALDKRERGVARLAYVRVCDKPSSVRLK
jgi:hypothetical protein